MKEEVGDGPFVFEVVLAVMEPELDVPGGGEIVAQGVFVWLLFWVTNIGTRSQRYFAAYQRLLDRQGREYSPDMYATRLAGKEFQDGVPINPGNRYAAYVAFDVPPGTQESDYVLSLHGSPHSAGVTVALKHCEYSASAC